MSMVPRSEVLALLRSGTAEQRARLIAAFPPSRSKAAAAALIASDTPEMAVLGLMPIIMEYCNGAAPAEGAVLADAVHERALELWAEEGHHGLLPTTLSALAANHVKALALLGRSAEVLDATDRYIDRYERLAESQNLPTLQVVRVEALINLRRIDEAARLLQARGLLDDPVNGLEARRLQGWVDTYRASTVARVGERASAPQPPSTDELLALMKTAIGLGFSGEKKDELSALVDNLGGAKCTDTRDPDQYSHLLQSLDAGERFLTGGTEDSALGVRARVRNASAIFVHEYPDAQRIGESLAELERCLEWARRHDVSELVNDALWSIYLCNNRLGRPSEAADALIALRGSLERLRSGIRDPMQRGGIFAAYPNLFNAMCAQLYKAGRVRDLLEAIEASKGRVIADKIAEQQDDVLPDAMFYASVARLPELCRRERCHYLTFFVDDERSYSVLVSSGGTLHAAEPVVLPRADLRSAVSAVRPALWGRPRESAPGSKHPCVAELLRGFAAALEGWLAQGVLHEGDHICYSPDDVLHNVPLHYVRLGGGTVLDRFSLSRVHSSFHLARVLDNPVTAPPDRFTGYVVPTREDLARDDGGKMVSNLEAPLRWLESHGVSGETVRLEDATPGRVLQAAAGRSILHFSTHGWFPTNGNPYHDSYLLLAGEDGLPDKEHAAGGARAGRLTPEALLAARPDLQGFHVSMMACLSGLAREGIAGDALGLDWAMIQCGASSLLSTHWRVSAGHAARFFECFYRNWIERRQSRGSAWRAAMLECMDGDSTPEAFDRWSAFSLTGDFR